MKALTILLILLSFNVQAFNTNRSEPIIGSLINNPSHLKEISDYSNTFAILPKKESDITAYLNANDKKMLPMIFINHLLYDSKKGEYKIDVEDIVRAIKLSYRKYDEIVFTFDEPMWNIRTACSNGIKSACEDIKNEYQQALSDIRDIIHLLKAKLPGVSVGVMHVEAFVEMIWQKEDWPHRNVILLEDADYVSFDCYGPVDRCGIPEILGRKVGYKSLYEYGYWIYESMVELETIQPKGRKILVVPQAFYGTNEFTHQDSIAQMLWYAVIAKNLSDIIGGYGVFAYSLDRMHGDDYMYYARDSKVLKNILKFVKGFL